jgi:hypothetical protein
MLFRSPGAHLGARGGSALRYGAAVTACALAAHAVAYRSVFPDDPAHRYLAWYAPLVAVISIASLVAVTLALTCALVFGPESRFSRALESVLPTPAPRGSSAPAIFHLASAALVFLAAQESLERSLAAQRLQLVSFRPTTLAVLVAIVLASASVVALLERVVSTFAEILFHVEPVVRRRSGCARWRPALFAARTPRPLSVHGGLRAPPLAT